jgi:hypothetical protein
MGGKIKVQPVSRAGLNALVALAEQLRAALPGWEGSQPAEGRAVPPSDLALDLAHLAKHDSDGFLTLAVSDEVVGFAAAHVRSRQLILPQIWILPELLDDPVIETFMRRLIAYGERSGAIDCVSHVLARAPHQALLFRFGLRPRFPVDRLRLAAERARAVGNDLARMLPGSELTQAMVARRTGAADLERLDRVIRGVARPMDHEHWLTERFLRLAKVREGQRVTAFAYGGPGQCGPVVASTKEGGLAGLGWALQLAVTGDRDYVELFVPAPFEAALETLLEAGATCLSDGVWMTRQSASGFERYVLASATLV